MPGGSPSSALAARGLRQRAPCHLRRPPGLVQAIGRPFREPAAACRTHYLRRLSSRRWRSPPSRGWRPRTTSTSPTRVRRRPAPTAPSMRSPTSRPRRAPTLTRRDDLLAFSAFPRDLAPGGAARGAPQLRDPAEGTDVVGILSRPPPVIRSSVPCSRAARRGGSEQRRYGPRDLTQGRRRGRRHRGRSRGGDAESDGGRVGFKLDHAVVPVTPLPRTWPGALRRLQVPRPTGVAHERSMDCCQVRGELN